MCEPMFVTTTLAPLTTAAPIGDFICPSNENCTIDCDELDPINGCSNSIINAKHASSLTLRCASSKNEFYGGCEMSTIWCPVAHGAECNIECVDYYACYLAKIYGEYSDTHAFEGQFQTLLSFGAAAADAGYSAIGPYKDATSRAMRYGPWMDGDKNTYTVDACHAACMEYQYFALQARYACFCENDWSRVVMYGSSSCGETGGGWCNYVYRNEDFNSSQRDVGQSKFNSVFQNSGAYIIRRECANCLETHQDIYYKRITNPLSFDAYGTMKLWVSSNNRLGVDFNMYSSLDDALK